MSGADPTPADGDDGPRRRAVVVTSHDDPEAVAAALRPDNTAEMRTEVVDDELHTTIERTTTGGLRATVDDYVVNCSVARRAAQAANRPTDTDTNDT